MPLSDFFIEYLDSEEINIPWCVQSELTDEDLVFIAIKYEKKHIDLDDEFDQHIGRENCKGDIERFFTKSNFENVTRTVILYSLFHANTFNSWITLNHGTNDPKIRLDYSIIGGLYKKLEDKKLLFSYFAYILCKYYSNNEEEELYEEFIPDEEEQASWDNFIGQFRNRIKSARNI